MKKMANGRKTVFWMSLPPIKLLQSLAYPWVPPKLKINSFGQQRGMDNTPPNRLTSSYQMKKQWRHRVRQTQQPTKQFWLDIWLLNLPNKICHFLWRAANDSLPTKLNLLKRNITANSMCDCYSCEIEDTIHALWDCIKVKGIWWELESCRPFLAERLVCFRDLCQGILAQNAPRLAETFAYMAWGIWHNRNAQRVGATTMPLGKIHTDTVERFHEFQAAWIPSSPRHPNAATTCGPSNALVTSTTNSVQGQQWWGDFSGHGHNRHRSGDTGFRVLNISIDTPCWIC